jgi:two-component system, OmpR family, phosphate regulon sensor histidine kinase PhoR
MAAPLDLDDPLVRQSFKSSLLLLLPTVGLAYLHPGIGLIAGLLGAMWVARQVRQRAEPLRQQVLALPVRLIRSAAPDEAEMASLVERARERVAEVLRQLRDERIDFQGILQGTTNGILVLGDDDRVERINEAAHRMLESPHDALGRSLSELSRNLELLDFVAEVRASPQPSPRQIPFAQSKGQRLLRITGNLIPGSQERQRVLLAMHDVTDLKRLEQVRTDFVTNVTHEMRSPLSSILGFAETLALRTDELPSDAVDGLERIVRNARRLNAIISDLVQLSRLEHAQAPELAPLAPLVFLEELLGNFQDAAAERQIALHLDAEDLPASMDLDRGLVERALNNLIDNAIKYSPPHGQVNIVARASANQFEVAVSDEGPGIPREHQARIFERFYRVDAARSRLVGGTGLGLAIVKHAAALHGGRVQVESALGEGTTFVLTLPLAPAGRGR